MKKFLALGISMSLLILLSSFTVLQSNEKNITQKTTLAKTNAAFFDTAVGFFDDANGVHWYVTGDNLGNATVYQSDIFFEIDPNSVGPVGSGTSFNNLHGSYTISVTYTDLAGTESYNGDTYRGPF